MDEDVQGKGQRNFSKTCFALSKGHNKKLMQAAGSFPIAEWLSRAR
jgi:hypothetical protein